MGNNIAGSRRSIIGGTFRFGAACILSAFLSSCAFMYAENRPLLNALDEMIQPEDPWFASVLTPIMVPAGFIAGLSDAVIVHPVMRIGPTGGTISKTYFDNPDESWATRSAMFLPRSFVAVPDFFFLWTVDAFWEAPEDDISGSLLEPTSPGLEIRVRYPEGGESPGG